MGILLAILAGGGSILNYMYLSNLPLQIGLTVLSLLSILLYGGRKTVQTNYSGFKERSFTLSFTICFVSFLGSGGILLGLLLHLN